MTSIPILAIRHKAQEAFGKYVQEGLRRHSAAVPSHLCIRTADDATFEYFSSNIEALGDVTRDLHDSKPLLWVKLTDPLIYAGYAVEWLEVTAPKADHPKTGPQMLVYQLATSGAIKKPTRDRSGFALRFQPHHAAQLAAQIVAPR